MENAISLSPKRMLEFLLTAATVRPVFIWGPPGIGKSSIVTNLASELGMPCVSLLGSQLAPEDLIGIPQISNGKSRFCPPSLIARDEPYCLFLDELNACSTEVQRAFYSLIHERRIGEYVLPKGSIVLGAGNRLQDGAITKPMASALINRMLHIALKSSVPDWLEWAKSNNICPAVIEYIELRPEHLAAAPRTDKKQEPFSTPRSWHMLSDNLHEFSNRLNEEVIATLAYACLSPNHAANFVAFYRQSKSKTHIAALMAGKISWTELAESKDQLYFMAQSLRSILIAELPSHRHELNEAKRALSRTAKCLIRDLNDVSAEMAQLVVSEDENGERVPKWLRDEIGRFRPELI